MDLNGQNIIGRQVIDVQVRAPVNGFDFQNQVDTLCRHELAQGLEQILEKYALIEKVIRLDTVFAEVQYSSLLELQSSFTQKILSEIEKQLTGQLPYGFEQADPASKWKRDRIMRLFLFYLSTGFLPWWTSVKSSAEWQQQLNTLLNSAHDSDWHDVVQVFRHKTVRKRLINILSQQQFWELMKHCIADDVESFRNDLERISAAVENTTQRQEVETLFKDNLLEAVSGVADVQQIGNSFARHFIQALPLSRAGWLTRIELTAIKTSALRSSIERISGNMKGSAWSDMEKTDPGAQTVCQNLMHSEDLSGVFMIEAESLYINNAGLVIVAAYFPMFFKDLRILSKAGVLDVDKAVAVMTYIITGSSRYEEFETVLPKVLCGLEPGRLITRRTISRMQKRKVRELLESVLEHWTVLKSTSVAGIRTSFLQREGKLSFENNEWNLKVRQESYDMLISHLPWNISLIKLPWMKSLLKVEWI